MCIYIQFEVLTLFSVQPRKTTRLFFVGTQAVEAIEEAKAARAAKAIVKKVPNHHGNHRVFDWSVFYCHFHKLFRLKVSRSCGKKTLSKTPCNSNMLKKNNKLQTKTLKTPEISVQVEEPAVWKLRKMRNANEINVVFWPMIISMMRSMMPIIFRR